MPLRALALLLPAMHAGTTLAHEYWLDPVGTQWQTRDVLQADIRNGQDFTGTPYPFDPPGLARGGLISAHERQALTGRMSDYSAIRFPLPDAVSRLTAETDEKGVVQFDVSSSGAYLVNSVLVLEPDAPPVHWVTLWSSLFFQQI